MAWAIKFKMVGIEMIAVVALSALAGNLGWGFPSLRGSKVTGAVALNEKRTRLIVNP